MYFGIIGRSFGLIAIIILLFLLANCFIYEKMGRKWWEAIIPFYNSFVYHECIFGNGWWFLIPVACAAIAAIPVIGPIVSGITGFLYMIVWNLRLAYSFNETAGFALGLMLLGPIFRLILAYGGSVYAPLEAFELLHPFTYQQKNSYDEAAPMESDFITATPDSRFCPACGNQLNPGVSFCPKCGTKVE